MVGACYLSAVTELPGVEGVCVCQSVCVSVWCVSVGNGPHCKLAGVRDTMLERGLCRLRGHLHGPPLEPCRLGFGWQPGWNLYR